MPVILGYSAAKVFKTNEYIAMVIGATLCYPTIVSLMTEESAVTLFGLHVTKANYVSTVIPIILAIFIFSLCATLFGKSHSRSSKNYYGSYAIITFNDSSHFIIIWTDRDLFR